MKGAGTALLIFVCPGEVPGFGNYVSRLTRPSTARTSRGAANQMAIAESALQPIAIQKASV